MAKKLMKYNPAFLTDEELIQSFVVRHTDLELVMDTIRENNTESNQHILIIGPRGSGKTTLVRRIAIEIRSNGEFQSLWYPLIFAEESYEVVSAGEFWLEALFHISEQTNDLRWSRTYEELKDERDEKVLRERALSQLMDFADSQEKRLLLMVENLNMLFDQISDEDAWALRHTLLNEPRIMLLASATPGFEKIEKADYAMFELFKIHELKALNERECSDMWKMVTGLKTPDKRIRPLQILTGGNPRLLAIISRFGAKLSLKELMDDLIHLVDDHTDYFKSQLDNLATIERKAYLALAEIWDPASAREIAKTARLEVNKTSSLLNRLVKRGYVSINKASGTMKWYQVQERLYNIYYLMRRRGTPANRVKAVVQFMIDFYGQDDLVYTAKLIAEEACKLSLDESRDHYFAYEAILRNTTAKEIRDKIIKSTPDNFFESSRITPSIKSIKETDIVAKEALNAVNKGVKLGKAEKYDEALKVFDNILDKYKERPESQIAEQVARAMTNKGITLGALEKSEEEIQVYDEMIEIYKDRPEPQIAELVAGAMFNKGIRLGALEKSEEAIQVYDEMIEIYKDRPEPQIAELVAGAMFSKGIRLGALEKSEKAIQVYDELIEIYKDRPEPLIAELVARAMGSKGITLGALEKLEEAEAMYRRAVDYKEDFVFGWEKLISLVLKQKGDSKKALQIAGICINKNSTSHRLMNSIAWMFYKNGDETLFEYAEKWAHGALAIAPDDANCHHTLACILAVSHKGNEALIHTNEYIKNVDVVKNNVDNAIELFVALAATGFTKEALELLIKSPSAIFLEPLTTGLKLYLEEDVKAAAEIMEIAQDIVKRIRERQEKTIGKRTNKI